MVESWLCNKNSGASACWSLKFMTCRLHCHQQHGTTQLESLCMLTHCWQLKNNNNIRMKGSRQPACLNSLHTHAMRCVAWGILLQAKLNKHIGKRRKEMLVLLKVISGRTLIVITTALCSPFKEHCVSFCVYVHAIWEGIKCIYEEGVFKVVGISSGCTVSGCVCACEEWSGKPCQAHIPVQRC